MFFLGHFMDFFLPEKVHLLILIRPNKLMYLLIIILFFFVFSFFLFDLFRVFLRLIKGHSLALI